MLNGGQRVALTYTNGLETIVLFQSPPITVKTEDNRQIPFGGVLSKMGVKTKFWTDKGKTFVLIADICEEEFNKIKESIE